MSSYTQGTQIYLISQKVKYSGMFRVVNIGGVSVFVYSFLVIVTITLMVVVIKGSGRLNFNKAINESSAKNGGVKERLNDSDDD